MQLKAKHPRLKENTHGCDGIFTTVAYNFNQGERRRKNKVNTKSSKGSHEVANEGAHRDFLLPQHISSHQSSVDGFLMGWITVFGVLLLIWFAYKYLSVDGWGLRLYRNESVLKPMDKWIRGHELSSIQRVMHRIFKW